MWKYQRKWNVKKNHAWDWVVKPLAIPVTKTSFRDLSSEFTELFLGTRISISKPVMTSVP